MIVFAFIWGVIAIALFFGQVSYCLKYPDDNGKWWLLEIIGVSIVWPLILLFIIGCAIYTVFKEDIEARS